LWDFWIAITYIASGSFGGYYSTTPMPIAPPFSQFDFLMTDTYKEGGHYMELYASLSAVPFAVHFLESIGGYIDPSGGPAMPVGYAQSFTAGTSTGNRKFIAQYVRIAYSTKDPYWFGADIQIP
jgi:hypothetical protein